MKKMLMVICLTITTLTLTMMPGCSKDHQSVESGPDSISNDASQDSELAARVNGSGIYLSELERAVKNVLIQNGMDTSHTAAFMEQFGPRLLDQLIQGKLLYLEAAKNGFEPEPAKIEEVLAGLSGRHESNEEFQSEMEARGFTEDTLRQSVKEQLTIQQYVEKKIVPMAIVPEETVLAAYEQNPQKFMHPEKVRASHILIKSEESDPQEKKEEALSKAKEIASMAHQEGADFAKLAREHSEGPSAPDGGDLGFFERGRMVKPFEEKAFSMRVGEISDPVLTRFGYHIIHLTDRRESVNPSFDEVKEDLASDLKNRMIAEMVKRKVDELKQDASIEILFKPASSDAQIPKQD